MERYIAEVHHVTVGCEPDIDPLEMEQMALLTKQCIDMDSHCVGDDNKV